jgi:hypothetical protein
VSLDNDPRFGPDVCADVLSWDYSVYEHDHFDFVWASPVCTQYSIARTTGPPRDLLSADKLVQRALLIMKHFGCNWAFENPQSGLLKTRDIVAGLPFLDTSYCKYGYPYRKTTRIWTSLALQLRSPCSLRDPCPALEGRRHPKTAQQSRRGSDPNDRNNTCSQSQLYSIPPGLCDAIAEAANIAALESDGSAVQPHARTDVQTQAAFIPEEL